MRRRVRLHALRIAAVAVDADDVAGVGRDDLAEGEGARRRVGEILHPVRARGAPLDVDDTVDAGLIREAHLAAGQVRLLGVPLLYGAFVGDGAKVGNGLGATR